MTLPNDDIPWELFAASLAGTLSSAEKAHLDSWLAADPAHREMLQSLRVIWAGAADVRATWDTQAALIAIKQRTAVRPNAIPLKVLPRLSQPASNHTAAARFRSALVAAAIAGLCIGGWWVIVGRDGPAAPSASMASEMRQYATARGQRLALKLPDGSGVLLGPESALRYAAAYGRRARIVELRGEAHFEVLHDAARPFEVRTAYGVARDLGTRFVVRARSEMPAVDVAVAEGRVALGRSGGAPSTAATPFADSLVLDRGDLGRITPAGELISQHDVSLDRYFGWTEGRLVFESADLADVVVELNRWYDVDIHLADSATRSLRLTATFRDQPVVEALSLIQASLGLKLAVDGRRFTLAVR